MLPDTVKLTQLETFHEDYTYYKDVWETISELREGAPAILRNPAKYLVRKPGEEEDVYRSRLAKCSYTPVFPNAVKKFVMSIKNSPLYIDIQQDDVEFWNLFRKQVDGARLKDRAWLAKVFSSLLFFGRHYLGVDLPDTGLTPRSQLEVSQANTIPYFVDFEPLQVIDFEPNAWYKTRQIVYQADPLAGRTPYLRYTLWTAEETSRYEAQVRLANPLPTIDPCNPAPTLLASTAMGLQVGGHVITAVQSTDGSWLPPSSPQLTIGKTKMFEHGLGRPAMVHTILNPELWTGRECYAKQLQHLSIESGWTESGALAGTLVRLFTPRPPAPVDDPKYVLEDPTSDNLKPDNNHVLIGQNFQFVESAGTAISNLTGQLDKIEQQIKSMVALDFGSVQPGNTAVAQSGASKEIDQSMQRKACETYGATLVDLYQSGLELGATLKGLDVPTVSGLDKFETQNLDKALEQTALFPTLPVQPPATAMRLWYGRLVELMVGDVSDADREALEQELDALFGTDANPNLDQTDLTSLSDLLGLPVDQIASILGGTGNG